MEIGGASLLVASLDDVIGSKRAAKRPRDLAVLEILEATRDSQGSKPPRKARGARQGK
jgi:hypothetical protein